MAEDTSYGWRPSYRGKKSVTAEVAAHVIMDLRKTGPVTAERLVEFARPRASVLHDECEWANQVAAHEWRKHQMRHMASSLVVIERREAGAPLERRPLVLHVPDPNPSKPGFYEDATIVLHNTNYLQRTLQEAMRFVDGAEQRLHEIQRLADRESNGPAANVVALVSVVREALSTARAAMQDILHADSAAAD